MNNRMDNESLRTLQILEEVSRNRRVTQRSLSKRLGVALGLTNLYLKRLARKGYIKVINIKATRLCYELTPKGIARKTNLALQYIQDSFNLYRDIRKKTVEYFEALAKEGCKCVVFYGAGEVAEIAYLSLQETGIGLVGIFDEERNGQTVCGFNVLHPSAIKGFQYDRLVITSINAGEDIERLLARYGVERTKVSRCLI